MGDVVEPPAVLTRLPSLDTKISWTSCCFTMDKAFVMYLVQTIIGIGLLLFCSYKLSTESDCDRAAPYWGLIGTICGFFFKSMAVSPVVQKRGVVQAVV